MKIRAVLNASLGLTLLSGASASAVEVTFQLNTSAQTALGNFKPETDTVFVAGDAINSWSPSTSELAKSESDTNLWLGTFDVPGNDGDTVQYKFVLSNPSGVTWEGNVGAGGGGNGNRTFILAATNQVLPVVYFNNVTNSTSVSANVTFQVDLSVQVAMGSFERDSGTVSVAGEFNAWNTTAFMLTNSPATPDLWTGTTRLTGAVDSALSYKFVLNGATWEGNVGPNGAQNRSVILKNTDQTLPVVFFSNVASIPSIIPLTFEVNMGVQITQGKFDPAAGTVAVASDLLNNWSTSASVLAKSATDSNVWTGTFDLSSSPGAAILYKFVANDGATWETGDNRTYTLSGTNAQTVPIVFFDRADHLGSLSFGPPASGKSTVAWTGAPLIRLQQSSDLNSPWQDVPNTQGQSSTTITLGNGWTFFRLMAK